MKTIDRDLLRIFHQVGQCEWCLKCRPTVPHHIYHRGMGGGSRLDVDVNLIALCEECHRAADAYKIPRRELWGIAAERVVFALLRA